MTVSTLSWMGYQVTLSNLMVERRPYPRSPARARRRAKKGHPQHHANLPSEKIHTFGNTMMMHPRTWMNLKARLEAEAVKAMAASRQNPPSMGYGDAGGIFGARGVLGPGKFTP
jgi:hypothetical protein